MEIVIRKYQKSDFENCMDAFNSNVPKYFTIEEVKEFKLFLQKLETNNNNTLYYVIELNHKVVGCGGFGKKNNSPKLTLTWGLIHQNFHKKGLGKKLLIYRLEKIKKEFTNTPVYVDTTQLCNCFFEKNGFTTTSIEMDYYTKGLHRYNMILDNGI